ncbi:hypothetical protein QTP86_018093, partial [Hemibagrus guttatus]
LDLQIAPAEVTGGQSAVLTCKTTCSLTDPTFIWYKNSHHLTTKTNESNEVHLQSVSSEDAGSYSCAAVMLTHLCKNYTWFKEKESSPVESGQSYRAVQSGQYYCEAQNKHGSEGISCTVLSALFWLRSKRQKKKADEGYQNTGPSAKDDTYAALDPAGRAADDVYHTLAYKRHLSTISNSQTPNSTMAKTKELSKDTRNKIVDLHQAGKTESAI